MVLIFHGRAYIKSTAAIRIAMQMDKPWPLMMVFLIIPAFIRHAVYDWVGTRRYAWYGKRNACWIPDSEIQHRFLS